MCMLCVIPPNVLPSREKLENSALNNPDGFGYAIAIPKEQRILVGHTMNADEAINDFLELKAKYPHGYALWHARLATHGSMCLENCHPFQVGRDTKTFLAHNGILPTVDEKKSDRSDTRILAESILPRMGGVTALDDPQMWSVLEEFTAGSKVVVLSVNPKAKYQMYLLHEKSGKYDESEVWWSNDSCDISYYTQAKLSYGSHYPSSVIGGKSSARTLDWALCMVCATEFDTWENVFCPRCSACLECTQSRVSCMCYNPADRAYFDSTYPTAWGVE
jgi:hypothetical protein